MVTTVASAPRCSSNRNTAVTLARVEAFVELADGRIEVCDFPGLKVETWGTLLLCGID
jgi:hypothetical protein